MQRGHLWLDALGGLVQNAAEFAVSQALGDFDGVFAVECVPEGRGSLLPRGKKSRMRMSRGSKHARREERATKQQYR